MFSKSTVTISLLASLLVPSSVLGAPIQGPLDADLDARAPVVGVTPRVHPGLLHTFRRRPTSMIKRNIGQSLLTRDPMRVIPKVHPALLHHFQRSEMDEDLVTRQPILGFIKNVFRGGKRDLGALEDLSTREWDELVEREPIFGMIRNIFRGGKRGYEDELELDARNFEELAERAPIFGIIRNIFRGGKREFDDLDAREIDELVEREPIFGMIRNIFRGGKRDLEAFDELAEREPLIPLLLGGALLGSMGKKRDFIDSYQSDLSERGTGGEIVTREWFGSLEELD
ncbi:hypothetical protein BKA70DRAFT_1339100 [Coprinopsis sp. MPI-PUGE-AT-0042]|nr:hypothetical protein BKA70DRAFT_1339100 [Coprinopsis sp. MPI-PUGE-AT-0042]